jgi:hypothetical protein
MSAAYRVRRPTEDAAVGRASKVEPRTAPFPVLFEALSQAHAFNDRRGVLLMQCRIARHIGTGCES